MTPEKRFLVTNQSGRGIAVTLPLSEIRTRWDMSFSNNPDDEFEESLGDWLDQAEVGDFFTNQEEMLTFTRVD